MSREDRVVAAALAFVRAHDAGTHQQAIEAMDNLRAASKELLELDATREKPRWRTTTTTLGGGG